MKITLLEPAMCCSTGLCGEDVDDVLLATAANIQWLKSLGHEVNRHNISNDGEAFRNYPQAIEKLRNEGMDSLPYVLINDRMVISGVYPTKAQWEKWLSNEEAFAPAEAAVKNSSDAGGCCSGPSCC